MDTHDKTWILHLDGFLAILGMQARAQNDTVFPILKHALRITDGDKDIPASEKVAHSVDIILLHMEVIKLRLRQLVAEHDRMTHSEGSIRNINFEKLRIGLKAVYKDALLLTSTMVLEETSVSVVDTNACRAVVVIPASHSIRIGTRLDRKQSFRTTLAHSKLQRSIHEAMDAIYASTNSLFPNEVTVAEVHSSTRRLQSTTFSAIFAMWPLYAARLACDVGLDQHGHIRDLLWRIGERVRIPKAMSLVS